MKNLIKSLLREYLEDSDTGEIQINIPFNKLILDKLNLDWAITNLKEKRPSRSKNHPMKVAMDGNGNYYLLDGYHRLVEAVLNKKTSTKGILINKKFEDLRKLNKVNVGCSGGIGDEHCSNFKNIGNVSDITLDK